MGNVLLDFARVHQQFSVAHREDLFPEVALVQRAFEDDFVQVLQLRKGESLGQEFEADRLIAHLALKPLVGCIQDPVT